MNPVSWFMVFVFRVICTIPLMFIMGVTIVMVINAIIFDFTLEIYMLLISSVIVTLVASISTVLQEDF